MQERPNTEWFHFVSTNVPEDTFHVIRFTGTEGLNTLFCFTIDLVSKDAAVDTGKVLNAPAVFTILREGLPDARFHGYPTRVSQGGHYNGYTYYTVELRPTFWKLTQMVQSAIFLDQNVQEAATALLNTQKYFAFEHSFRLTRQDYPKPEFAMQYDETLYDYILWRMEEQGAYFFFAQDRDAVVFADAPQSHEQAEGGATVFYSPTSGLESGHREEVINAFSLSQTPLPHQVVIRNYDWKNPNKPVVGVAAVSESGLGDVYLSHEKVASDAEAERLAKIRAEELICRSRIFSGSGSVPNLRPGYVFTLDQHYNPAFNRDYLVTSLTHEGCQESFLSLGLGIPLHKAKDHLFYRNSFSCIEADVTYRPARMAPRAKISGMIHAFVDGAGSGNRAELDAYGRYKLLFPFDISGRKNGSASCWIRMAQQQVGQDSGLSFPLLPGTEVVVSFIDGDPDCPVITGALANGETGAITGQGNANFSGIRTAGGNQITINDTDTHQGISLNTASGNGMTMSSGSLDYLTNATDTCLSASSVFSTDVAGVAKSIATGYLTTTAASKQHWAKITALCSQAVLGPTANMLNTLSAGAADTTVANGLAWGGAGVKMLGVVLESIMSGIVSGTTPGIDYGAALLASDGVSKSQMQVNPSVGSIAASTLFWILGRLTSFGTKDLAKAIVTADGKTEDKAKAQYTGALNDAMDALYQSDATAYAVYKAGSTLRTDASVSPCAYYEAVSADLSARISSLERSGAKNNKDTIAGFKSKKATLEKTWTVYCNDSPSNSSYYFNAKQQAIRTASVSSVSTLVPEIISLILLCLGTHAHKNKTLGGILLKSPDGNINMMSEKPVSMHSESGVLMNTRFPSASPYDNAAGDKLATVENWGNTLAATKHHADFMNADFKAVQFTGGTGEALISATKNKSVARKIAGVGWGKKDVAIPENTFIASTTDIHYSDAQWRYANTTNESIQRAKQHVVQSGDSKLFIDDKDITITTNQNGKIDLNTGANKLNINSQHVNLATKDGNFISGAVSSTMKYKDSSVSCMETSISLEAGDEGKITIEKDIDIQPKGGGKVQIAKMVIEGDQIKGTGDGILELSGAIKIIGAQAQVNLQSVANNAQKALDDLKKQQKADQKAFEELQKQIDKLSAPKTDSK